MTRLNEIQEKKGHFNQAISENKTLKLDYQGNPRHVIPLVYGVLKNGKEALLCYKIIGEHNNHLDLAIRLYHLDKISNVKSTDRVIQESWEIDYYLTKHFKTIYSKI